MFVCQAGKVQCFDRETRGCISPVSGFRASSTGAQCISPVSGFRASSTGAQMKPTKCGRHFVICL